MNRKTEESNRVVGSDGDSAKPESDSSICDRCGEPARVKALEKYINGEPVYRYLCLECADAAYEAFLRGGAGHTRPPLSMGSLLVFAGLVLAVLGVSADWLGFHGSPGFGFKQQGGLLIGALVVVVGVFFRVDVLVVCGSILLAAALLADVSGLVGAPGVGWRQWAVIVAGLSLVLTGLFLRRFRPHPSPQSDT